MKPHTWRYGCRKRVYKTFFKDGSRSQETLYDLVEVYSNGKSWTEEAVTMSAGSKADLVKWMKKAIKDIEDNEVIVDDDFVRRF
jgi:hypothetical protein